MPCYFPLSAYRSRIRTKSGKLGITFNKRDAYVDMPIELPCGKCIGCRLERSRQWAVRCLYEAQLHDENCYITLTYDPEFLPSGGTLDKRHFQLFMKRLRKAYSGRRIRFFHCGEYGSSLERPHYHAIIFGLDFEDRVLYEEKRGVRLDTSDSLARLWPFGFSTVGNVTFESAAYVARYVTKKVSGEAAERHYERVIPETGEVISVLPEYVTMSLKPGIGAAWFDRFSSDVYPSDEVVVRGRAMKPPKYFDRLLERSNPSLLEQLKLRRISDAVPFKADSTPERLRVRETVKQAQFSMLKRGIE